MDWKKYGYIIASKYRQNVVLSVDSGPKTPKQISNATGFYLSHVSSVLKDLSKKGVIKCLTPDLRRGKVYALTKEGKEIADKLKKLA